MAATLARILSKAAAVPGKECALIPVPDELGELGGHVGAVGTQPLALEDAEPLLDLIHPGAVPRRAVHPYPGMLGAPGAQVAARVDTDVVADQRDGGAGGGHRPRQQGEEAKQFGLALPREHGGAELT